MPRRYLSDSGTSPVYLTASAVKWLEQKKAELKLWSLSEVIEHVARQDGGSARWVIVQAQIAECQAANAKILKQLQQIESKLASARSN